MLRAIGLSIEQADASIRFSFGRYSTAVEVDAALLLIFETLKSMQEEDLSVTGM